jgi:hypothetical protein
MKLVILVSALVFVSVLMTTANVFAKEAIVKNGNQIVTAGQDQGPVIITGQNGIGPAHGGGTDCVEPLGCPPPPPNNAK